MENEEQVKPNKASKKKWLIGGVIVALILAGAISVGAFVMKSPKSAYFAAESKTASEMLAFFEEKYKEEMKWSELAKTAIIQSDYKITADIEGEGMEDPVFELLHSAALNLSTTTDLKNKQYVVGIGGEIADAEVEPFEIFLMKEQFLVNAPFLTEALSVSGEKLNELTDGEFSCTQDIMQQTELLTKAQQDYLMKNLGKALYEALPSEAFTKEKNKIVMDLSKQDVNKVATALAEKMEKDAELETILRYVLATQGICDEEVMKNVKEEILLGLKDVEFGIVSTIWIEKGKIVAREVTFKESKDFVIAGKQSVGKEVTFNYEVKDTQGSLSLDGEFQKGMKASDRVNILFDEVKFTYEAEESKEKDIKSFERKLMMDAQGEEIIVNWDGSAQFTADRATGEHIVYIEHADIGKMSMTIEQDSKKIKELVLPKKVKDISKLTDDELSEYMLEVMNNMEAWAKDFMTETGFDDYFANDYYADDDYADDYEDAIFSDVIGLPASPFELVDLNGHKRRLADYEGKALYLYFWDTWNEASVEEMRAINRQYQVFKEQGVEVLAINIAESKEDVQDFVADLPLDFPIVIDETTEVMSAYDVGYILPATVVISATGEVVDIFDGELTEEEITWYMEYIMP